MPKISVIIPTYNRALVIEKAVRSVLIQTYIDFELIIVDDGSQGRSQTFPSKFDDKRIRYINHKKNLGPAAARNTGIYAARGKYIAFLDSDDEWFPRKLEDQLEFMENTTGMHASCTGYIIFSRYHSNGDVRIGKTTLSEKDFFLGCRASPGSTLMAEKEIFDEVGFFDANLRRLEDWDWLLRYTQFYNLCVLPEVLSKIDGLSNIGPKYEKVIAAREIMKKKYCTNNNSSRPGRRKILSTLENELAAVAYKNRNYHIAIYHLLMSIFYYPLKSTDSLKRIFKALRIDLFRSLKNSRLGVSKKVIQK